MDCSPPGSSVHEIFQARILEWVAISFSRRSSQPRDWTQVSYTAGRSFTNWATREASESIYTMKISKCYAMPSHSVVFDSATHGLPTREASNAIDQGCFFPLESQSSKHISRGSKSKIMSRFMQIFCYYNWWVVLFFLWPELIYSKRSSAAKYSIINNILNMSSSNHLRNIFQTYLAKKSR